MTESADSSTRADWWHAIAHPSRRGWMLIVSAATTVILLGVALWLPVPFVKLSPGPTFNVIGEDDGQQVISITGAETFPVRGDLDMTTVYESGGPRGGLTFVDAIASWFDPADAVVPRELLFPEDATKEEVEERQALLWDASGSNAIGAALNYLGRPVITTVVASVVYEGTPADGLFLPKDEIITLDGKPITKPTEVVEAVRGAPIGTEFAFGVRRHGEVEDGQAKDSTESQVTVRSAANPTDPSTPYIGLGVGTLNSAGFPIDFTLDKVGGPSAGLVFSLGIIDKLTPEDLVAGQHIAGTGTITPDGEVGPIGGIRQKLVGARDSGATLFLMPADHCAEAEGHVPDGLTVTPVTTLADAVDAIRDYTAGRPVLTCPVDAA